MKLNKLLASFGFVVVTTLGTVGVAEAHVTLNPQVSEPGSYEEYSVRVPVERNDQTVKLELEVPKGVSLSTVQPVNGFKHSFKKDGKGNIEKVTWTATNKGIGPHEHVDFPIVVANPEEAGEFKWKATQTYKDGTVVRWTDEDEKSETPAPVTKVKAADTEHEETPSTGGQTALWIVSILALIVSAVALFKQRNLTKTDK
ncbi:MULTISPECIES: YcnI family protein [unclassified Staphylococcus]|uniref:YcnI family copper-binding membrane protein n=1 Tax=unclassified Staphylococcus TaxID=91994 RepID=UPI0021D33BDE|nr:MULTISPECIES: YcnI family protein [unclassified Staphylococcus]UXR78097.1 YcnI family protein [Staphylococcus sp. IVB6227]UXR82260.1 YcnI family protein [Staphylococcus sp. IVB6214]